MSTTTTLLTYGETALAAYATSLQSATSNRGAYVIAGMSTSEAARFDDTWQVLSQSPTSLDGFSAVLLQHRQSGEKVLAIRGTNDPADLITDILDIALIGNIANMSQYRSLEAFYAGLVSTGTLSATEQITVTGHSLGGFLAQAFTARHAGVVGAAYTYNAPGFGGGVAQMLSFFGLANASAVNGRIVNVRAADGVSATAGLGQVLGSVQQVRIEAGTADPIYYHSIATLTDTLAVYSAFSLLHLSVDRIHPPQSARLPVRDSRPNVRSAPANDGAFAWAA